MTDNGSDGRSAPATDLTLVTNDLFGELELTPDQAEALRESASKATEFAGRARAANTLTAYRSAWKAFSGWCRHVGLPPLTGSPKVIALYLASAADRLSVATLELHLSAIVAVHRSAGVPIDRKHRDIATVLEGIARSKSDRRPRKVAPILPPLLLRMVRSLPRTPKGVRDRALILIGFGAALRRSEIVALDLADLKILDRGVIITIRRSKGDQKGEGQEVAIERSSELDVDVVDALKAWLAVRGRQPGPLFIPADGGGALRHDRGGLTGQTVARIVKAAAADVECDPKTVSGHSLRAGLATAAAAQDAQLHDIMRHTRHKNADVAAGYIREASLWKRNVSGLVFSDFSNGDNHTAAKRDAKKKPRNI